MGCKLVLWYLVTNDYSDVIYFHFFGDYQCSTLYTDRSSLAVCVYMFACVHVTLYVCIHIDVSIDIDICMYIYLISM